MKIKDLDTVCVVGLGLLGGSIGMAVNRSLKTVKCVGYSHRSVTRLRALELGVIDECYDNLAEAVDKAQLVILASPIGTFAELMQEMAQHLKAGCIVTDVGSTKVLPTRWARKYLPRNVKFLGSHPMAGSEQRGVEFARADLFDDAHCIITPTSATSRQTVSFLSQFWKELGLRICRMNPAEHDRILARISHLPHILATALINCSDEKQMLLCGKGFLDTTRIASGPPGVWHDIIMSNDKNTDAAIDRLISQLRRLQKALRDGNNQAVTRMLNEARSKRDNLVAKKLKRKELPS